MLAHLDPQVHLDGEKKTQPQIHGSMAVSIKTYLGANDLGTLISYHTSLLHVCMFVYVCVHTCMRRSISPFEIRSLHVILATVKAEVGLEFEVVPGSCLCFPSEGGLHRHTTPPGFS